MKRFMTLLPFCLLGCASTSGHMAGVKSVNIEFKGKTGEVSDTRYYSNSHMLTYQDGQLLRDRTEAVDFTVRTHVIDADPAKKILRFTTKTVRKDGTSVDLHDLAFPELNEQIEYAIRANGEVLRAGHFPPQSLFYVPSLPVPIGPVKVGDTWPMEHAWLSAKEGIPLKLQVLAILKDIVPCEGGKKPCADIEISGHVTIAAAPATKNARFASRLWGRMLFSVERGDIIWSEVRSQEEMDGGDDLMKVASCMVSETKLSADYKTKFTCEPKEVPVEKVPAL